MTKEQLIKFWKDANSYQSIDVPCFNIDEFADTWIKEQTEVNDCVIPDVRICAEQFNELIEAIRSSKRPTVFGAPR